MSGTRYQPALPFYKSKIWRQQRLHALERDHYECVDCHGPAEEVHHRIPVQANQLDNYEVTLNLDNLVCLCHNCHTKRHAGSTAAPAGFHFDEQGQIVPDAM